MLADLGSFIGALRHLFPSTCYQTSFWCAAGPRWLAAIGTLKSCVLALGLALYGTKIQQLRIRPKLVLNARVQRPAADLARRWQRSPEVTFDLGEVWFFRLEVTNRGSAPARDVQVALSKIERQDEGHTVPVDRFTPMNLMWTNTASQNASRVIAHRSNWGATAVLLLGSINI
jgi:hypothetical protein